MGSLLLNRAGIEQGQAGVGSGANMEGAGLAGAEHQMESSNIVGEHSKGVGRGSEKAAGGERSEGGGSTVSSKWLKDEPAAGGSKGRGSKGGKGSKGQQEKQGDSGPAGAKGKKGKKVIERLWGGCAVIGLCWVVKS